MPFFLGMAQLLFFLGGTGGNRGTVLSTNIVGLTKSSFTVIDHKDDILASI